MQTSGLRHERVTGLAKHRSYVRPVLVEGEPVPFQQPWDLHEGAVEALVFASWKALSCCERELIKHAERGRDKAGRD